MNLKDFYSKKLKPRQKQYEAVRAVAFDEGSFEEIALRFGYSPQSLRNLVNLVLQGEHKLFPEIKPGPKGRQTSLDVSKLIISLRRQEKLSSYQIVDKLEFQGTSIGVRTVERVLSDAGFPKLKRRTFGERGISTKGTLLPERSAMLDLSTFLALPRGVPGCRSVFLFALHYRKWHHRRGCAVRLTTIQ